MSSKALFKKIRYILLFAGVFLIFLVIRRIGLNEFLRMISSLRLSFIILACIIWAVTLFLAAFRFRLFLNSHLDFYEIFEIFLFGYLYNYAGGVQGVGIAARLGMLKLKKVDIARSSASIGSEIVCDALVSAAILFGGLFFYGADLVEKIKQVITIKFLILPTIAIIGIVLMLVFFNKKNLIKSFNENISRSLLSKRILNGIGITFSFFLLTSAVYFIIFHASGMNPGFFNIFFAFGSGYACGLLSLVPGGLGVRDIVFGYILSLSNISFETGVSISIIVRVVSIGTVLLMLVMLHIITYFTKTRK